MPYKAPKNNRHNIKLGLGLPAMSKKNNNINKNKKIKNNNKIISNPKKKPKIQKKTTKSHVPKLITLSKDIETNLGPMPNILETHPLPHKRRYKTYYITCTIKLQPEYQHLAKTFSPILKIDHPNHINAIRNFPYLIRYLNQKRQQPTPRLLFCINHND